MSEIIVQFNKTTNSYYKSYAKIVYSVSYSDNVSALTSTATVNMDFYIKPDSYTYTLGTSDTLYLGMRKGSSTATLTKNTISPTLTTGTKVSGGTYNHVGSTSMSVTYTSTSSYNIYLAAGYTNDQTERFGPFYMPESDGGSYEEYDYTTSGTNVVTLEKRIDNTACTAPSSVSLSLNPFGTSLVLSWSGASSGTANTISSYEIQYRTSSNASTWSAWSALTTVTSTATSGSYTHTPSISEGYYIQYQIRTRGSAGSSWYSAWKEFSYSRKNSTPSQVSSISLSTDTYSQGESVTISWASATDVDGNISNYNLQYSANNGSWTALKTQTGTSYTFTPSQIDDEEFLKFRVCAVDSFGLSGSYKESSTLYREDYSGVKLCVNGAYEKVSVFVCQNGVYEKAQVYVCQNSEYKKGVN